MPFLAIMDVMGRRQVRWIDCLAILALLLQALLGGLPDGSVLCWEDSGRIALESAQATCCPGETEPVDAQSLDTATAPCCTGCTDLMIANPAAVAPFLPQAPRDSGLGIARSAWPSARSVGSAQRASIDPAPSPPHALRQLRTIVIRC
ncbi:MAG: hypothetical protein H0V44_10810 [Planctomycetes bacterium]|nr:hypothetical protein [Planctomycetota bacterium]